MPLGMMNTPRYDPSRLRAMRAGIADAMNGAQGDAQRQLEERRKKMAQVAAAMVGVPMPVGTGGRSDDLSRGHTGSVQSPFAGGK